MRLHYFILVFYVFVTLITGLNLTLSSMLNFMANLPKWIMGNHLPGDLIVKLYVFLL